MAHSKTAKSIYNLNKMFDCACVVLCVCVCACIANGTSHEEKNLVKIIGFILLLFPLLRIVAIQIIHELMSNNNIKYL